MGKISGVPHVIPHRIHINGGDTGEIQLRVRGAAGQTANILEAQNSAGTSLFTVDNDGDVSIAGNLDAVINETLTGNITLSGNLTVNGNTTLGNASTDTFTINATPTFLTAISLTTALTSTNNATFGGFVSSTVLNLPRRGAAPATMGSTGRIYTFAGDANTTELWYRDAAGNDVQITDAGALEGASLFWDDDEYIRMGNVVATPDVRMGWNTTQTVDAWYFGTADAQNVFLIAENGDRAFDFAHGAQTNPTVFIHSAAQSTTEALRLNYANVAFLGAGLATTATEYSIGRNADATNRLQLNVPTGAIHEISVNDVAVVFVTASTLQTLLGSAAQPSFVSMSDTNTGLFWTGVDVLGFATNAIEVGRFNISGNLILGVGEGGTTVATGNNFRAPSITTGGLGNIAAASMTISGGLGTGTGDPSRITFQVSTPTTAGDNLQSYFSALVLDGDTGTTALLSQPVATSGVPIALRIVGGAHTSLDASSEATDIFFNLTRTVQFSTGVLATQRAMRIGQPTYGFVGVSTLNNAYTVEIAGPPRAGTNATITLSRALAIGSGGSANPVDTTSATMAEINMPDIANGVGAMTNLIGLQLTSGGAQLGNQTATLDFFAGVHLLGVTLTSDTFVRTVTTAATLRVAGPPVASTNVTISGPARAVNIGGDAVTTGTAQELLVSTGAHTGMTLSTAVEGIRFDLSATKQWATGAITTQQEFRIDAPTYGFVGASTITNAQTIFVNRPPRAGTNATITIAASFQMGGAGADANAGTSSHLFLYPLAIRNGYGLMTTLAGLIYSDGGAGVSLGNQTAVLTNLNAIRLGAITYTSTTLVRTVTNPATLYIGGAPVASTNVSFSNTARAIEVAAGTVEMNDHIVFNTGVAVVATDYSIGRDADGTNQFHWNVPTGATFELSVNDVAEMTLSATAVNFQNNTITTTGGGSLTGTWSDLGSVTTIDINGGTVDGVTIGGAVAGTITGTTITATSFVIGANTLTTSEWAFLDGQNQAIATTSSPTFVNLTITSFAANWTNAGRTVADLGIITTVDINGGTIDGATIGGAVAGAITGTTITANTNIVTAANADVNMSAGGRLYGGGIQANYQTLAANTNLTLDENDSVVEVTTGAVSNNTITLPAASGNQGMIISVYLITDGGLDAVITRAGADVIQNGSADLANTTVTLNDAGDYALLQCVSASMWQVVVNSGATVA